MTICCARLSKVYMILTNALFASLGLAFLAFGSIGMKSDFYGSSLFPINTFKWLAILGAIVCVASIFGAVGAFIRKKFITCIYMIIILVALVLQVIIGIKIYKASANIFAYMSDLWTSASTSYRTALQNEFSCCGFQTSMDNYAITDQCQPTASSIQDAPPCADILINYAKSAFRKAYLVVFAALALEVLAMTNAITLLCTSFDAEDENERRKHRKSGSSYTLPEEQKKHYADSPIGDSYSSYSAHDVNSPIHDSNRYEVYNHQNDSNIYHQDNHGYNTGSRVNAYY